jgi:hypothetical protein
MWWWYLQSRLRLFLYGSRRGEAGGARPQQADCVILRSGFKMLVSQVFRSIGMEPAGLLLSLAGFQAIAT